VFYVFERPPLLYNPVHDRLVRTQLPDAYQVLQNRYDLELKGRAAAATAVATAENARDESTLAAATEMRVHDVSIWAIRTEALNTAARLSQQSSRDVNYIIPRFVLDHLPIGLAGLFIAAILAAAMNAIAAELNSLATTSVIDFYKRWWKREATETHYLKVSRAATAFWGVFACIVATFAANLGSLIEVVNRFGSFFYGSILGVFLLAMIPRARGTAAFVALIAGMTTVGLVNWQLPGVAFLWHNVIGAVTVVLFGLILSGRRQPA
jgi:Na+/proline symporter